MKALQQSEMTGIKYPNTCRSNSEYFPFYLLFLMGQVPVHFFCQRQNMICKMLVPPANIWMLGVTQVKHLDSGLRFHLFFQMFGVPLTKSLRRVIS